MENKSCRISDDPRKLSFKYILEITDCLSQERKLGQGSFGQVYKGVLEDGEEVAVKMLNFVPGINDQQFENEFEILKTLKHPNIVQLLGFCDEYEDTVAPHDGKLVNCVKVHRALCLEFVPNGTLGELLSNQLFGVNWPLRYKIIKGICKGLQYLHEGLDEPILHFDLKPNNILLDENMVPKIADFGLSRLLGEENTKMTFSPLGTLGYLPPEFITKQIISKEYDIFSLGVIMNKIITGIMDYSSIADMEPSKFVRHVHDNWRKRLEEIPRYASLEADCEQLKRCILIAVNCMDKDRHRRPKIKEIVSKLDEIENGQNNSGWQIEFLEKFDNAESRALAQVNEAPLDGPSEGTTDNYKEDKGNDQCVKYLSFDLLETITDNFSDNLNLGSGGYGTVYKGVLTNGKEIVVERFHPLQGFDEKTFEGEVVNLTRVNYHRNILKLIGWCHESRRQFVEHNGMVVTATSIERAMCYEYIQNGSLDNYITDEACGLDWQTCYKIIVGICDGLMYIHKAKIYHLDLKPANIMLDKSMVPKIADLGISRIIASEKTHVTSSIVGTLGYMPPEYIERGLISNKFDIFSLGVIMMKIMLGLHAHSMSIECPAKEFINLVTRNWMKRLEQTFDVTSAQVYLQQVEKCLEIALQCVEPDRRKRPSIGDVVLMLNETETLVNKQCDLWLLNVRLHLPYHFEPKRLVSCTLQLCNNGDHRVAFRILLKNKRRYHVKLPACGIVPPRSTYTLVLTMRKQMQQSSSHSDEAFTLQSVRAGNQDSEKFHQKSVIAELFEQADNAMQEVMLNPVCHPLAEEESCNKPAEPQIEVITSMNAQEVSSIEMHETEPWIMTTHRGGNLRVWNYQTMEVLNSFEVTEERVCAAKFVAREKWIVAGDNSGYINVYHYGESHEVTSFEAHGSSIVSLAVHATKRYVVSSAFDDSLIKLWDWERGWECTRTFQGSSHSVIQIIFNPEDTNNFTSVSSDGTVMIWSLRSKECQIITTTMDDHPVSLLCANYVAGGLWKHLISGSKDWTAQIWDIGTKKCVEKLKGHADQITAVFCHLEFPDVITGSLDGTVRIWDSITYRLHNIIGFNLGAVYAIGYISGLRRIVVGCDQGIATMDINSW